MVSDELVKLATAAGLKARLQGRGGEANPFDGSAEPQLHQAWWLGWDDPLLPLLMDTL